MSNTITWWKATEGDEYHTARVWGEIEKAAREAGDEKRAEEAHQAAEFESDK